MAAIAIGQKLTTQSNLTKMKPSTRLPNIYLIGPMGAGKTSVGRRLAKLSQLQYIDTDDEVCARSGVDINWIFEVEGESGFRKREAALILELSQRNNLLVSTGGGSIMDADSRKNLRDTGIVVYLQVSFEQQFDRTQQRRGTRPMLESGESFRDNLESLNREREPLYQSIAHLSYLTDKFDPTALAKKIYNDVQQLNDEPS